MDNPAAKPPIPSDDELLAMDDTGLLDLLAAHELDSAKISDRDGAIAALKSARDSILPAEVKPESANGAEPATLVEEKAEEPASDPAAEAEDDMTINTVADEGVMWDGEPAKRPTVSELLFAQSRAAQMAGDMGRHAALHNFEIAVGDFKRAAAQVEGIVPENSPLSAFLTAVREQL